MKAKLLTLVVLIVVVTVLGLVASVPSSSDTAQSPSQEWCAAQMTLVRDVNASNRPLSNYRANIDQHVVEVTEAQVEQCRERLAAASSQ
jgi:hypothetical protein